MNAILLQPSRVDPPSQPAPRVLPAPERIETGSGGNPPRATAAPPFWTWFIANPRSPRGV